MKKKIDLQFRNNPDASSLRAIRDEAEGLGQGPGQINAHNRAGLLMTHRILQLERKRGRNVWKIKILTHSSRKMKQQIKKMFADKMC